MIYYLQLTLSIQIYNGNIFVLLWLLNNQNVFFHFFKLIKKIEFENTLISVKKIACEIDLEL